MSKIQKQLTPSEEVVFVGKRFVHELASLELEKFGGSELKVLCSTTLFILENYGKELEIRPLRFDEKQGSLTRLKASINRFVITNALLCAEAGLDIFFYNKGISPINGKALKANASIFSILEKAGSAIAPDDKEWLKKLKRSSVAKPEFNEQLSYALSLLNIPKKEKTSIHGFFDFLRIIRNKCSHLDASLTDHEKNLVDKFAGYGFQIRVAEIEGVVSFEITFIFFLQVFQKLKDFFKILEENISADSQQKNDTIAH